MARAVSSALRHRRWRRGANAIEFAIILPIWVMITLGIIEFSWMYYQQSALNASAALGCRAGSLVDPGDDDQYISAVETKAEEVLLASLIDSGGGLCDTCLVDAYTVGTAPGRSLVCEVSREVDPILGFLASRTTLDTTQVSRLEWQREAAP